MGLTLGRLFLLSYMALAAGPALAQTVDLGRTGQPVYIESVPVEDERKNDAWVGQVGMSLNLSPRDLGAGEHVSSLGLDVRVSYKDTFFIENNKIGAVVTSRRLLRAGVIARFNDGRRDDLIRPDLNPADELGDAVEIGLFAGTSFYKLFLTAEAYMGTGEVHGGFQVELEGGYLFELNSKFKLVPVIGGTWGSPDYMKAYFGVPRGHERFPAYRAGGGLYEVHAELSSEHRLAKNWLLKGGIRLSKLKDNAALSPFAREHRVQARAQLGVVWLF
ncbi:MipA/OmpV family protein [Kordiimonas sp.]|uniref:MipA/OmpV family protein n=1 Tax=Kordiimonas sp. TaxID=1970157 RepID=UPI003A93BDA8